MNMLALWNKLKPLPMGPWLFSKAVGLVAPYAGSINARVTRLEAGKVTMRLSERRAVRNHLKSIHALALVNLGELAVNLALMTLQPKNGRFIVTGLEAGYEKKARGLVTTEVELQSPDWSVEGPFSGESLIRDAAGDLVTRVKVNWKVGPR